MGLVVSLVALGSFYAANSFVLELGPHPWVVDLRLAVEGGKTFFVLAIFSGPAFGWLGGLWARTKSVVVPIGMAILFILEPFAFLATKSSGSAVVWLGEVAVGVAAILAIVRFAPRSTAP